MLVPPIERLSILFLVVSVRVSVADTLLVILSKLVTISATCDFVLLYSVLNVSTLLSTEFIAPSISSGAGVHAVAFVPCCI